MSDKITPAHRERCAYVYIRQSTPGQVRNHLESQRRQYGLQDLAQSLGFQQVVVIDEDLGRSGAGTVERPGFGRLLTEVCAGKVGGDSGSRSFSFGQKQSRLAPSHRSLRDGGYVGDRSRWRL